MMKFFLLGYEFIEPAEPCACVIKILLGCLHQCGNFPNVIRAILYFFNLFILQFYI